MTALEILEKLIAFDTTSANSNLALIDYVEDFLKKRNFRVSRVLDPTGQKAGLFAAYGPDGAGIMLSAHTDVVPVTGQTWTRPAFKLTREGGRLYGRGTTDMKGYLAAMLSAADRASKMQLTEPLKLSISYDEEIGCVGIQHMIDQLKPTIGLPRACFVGEPTSMNVATGHKGKAALLAVCHGTSGHSALAPLFTNALHLAADFIVALRDLQEEFARSGARDTAYRIPYSTLHVGKVSGGQALNVVADRAEILLEYRHLAADHGADIFRKIEAAAGAAARRHTVKTSSARIVITTESAYPGLNTNEDADITTFAKAMAQRNQTTKVAFGTEAGFFNALEIPTIVCGPGSMEGQGHKEDEFIMDSELAACDQMLDRILHSMK